MDFVHFADAHAGLSVHGKVDITTGVNDRTNDVLLAIDYILDYVESHDIDVVLFAGDMYHRNNPSVSLIREVSVRVRELAEMCPVVLVPGNHDQALNRVSAVDMFDALGVSNVYVNDEPTCYTFQFGNESLFVGALPYPRYAAYGIKPGDTKASITESVHTLVSDWQSATEFDSADARILLAHLTIEGARWGAYTSYALGSDDYFSSKELAKAWDYVALGHIHLYQDLAQGDVPVVYSGSIERVDYGEEHEDKGFVHGTISNGEVTYKFVPIPVRPMKTIEIDATSKGKATMSYITKLLKATKVHPDSLLRFKIQADSQLHVNVHDIYKLFPNVYRITGVHVTSPRETLRRTPGDVNLFELKPHEMVEEWLLEETTTDDDEIDEVLKLFQEIKEKLDDERS